MKVEPSYSNPNLNPNTYLNPNPNPSPNNNPDYYRYRASGIYDTSRQNYSHVIWWNDYGRAERKRKAAFEDWSSCSMMGAKHRNKRNRVLSLRS